ncbi:4a-hydroxytetrahydrobiopterin dehydratase [Cyanobacterium stanieri LEGE 03274]|uniref:Putative pterin-4-alpha-carbinolamine dehydratase n=1 Tax=Cyanobacterium stanieri LEGE 03274 TaxID=1828756 RepID=A0ABR9V5P8_9CHRO|nr:4a-hydroxytetrahydrobiopterin dehydratase [Cyanobacterium stanieri]MBE9223218.1 4a-hydroxytetrahydrobiopterin dehydratase [Cyanobacterium stanieri LEGE 03274]
MLLNQQQIQQKLENFQDWNVEGKNLVKTFQFDDFLKAIDFVNQLVAPAESAGHHPDISISYNKVTINLTSHDQGGITEKDFDLAQKINQIFT